MKKLKSWLVAIAVLLCSTVANAYSFEVSGIYYDITNPSLQTVSVVSESWNGNSYSGKVVVPATVNYNGVEYAVTSIGYRAFVDCSSLTSVTLPSSVISIGEYAFLNCSSLTRITLPASVTSIGNDAFSGGVKEVILESVNPPVLSSTSLISEYGLFIVPQSAINDYLNADYWKELSGITYKEACERSVSLTALANLSALEQELGKEVLPFVADLTISGTINSYDFMVMLNKMNCLRHVDLSDAHIVYNEYQHYTGYHTDDNKLPSYAFHMKDLLTVRLPQDITSIGQHAFSNCYFTHIDIPVGVTSIGYDAFASCVRLKDVTFPEGVVSIDNSAFSQCYSLTQAILPTTLQTIGYSAFWNCSQLAEVRIPSSVRSIGDVAFYGCDNLQKVYVYTVEPTNINQDTFAKNADNNFVGTLYAPKVSFETYWYDTQWSQFEDIVAFDEPFDNFHLEGDKVLDNSTGAIEGTEDKKPDAEMGNNSGLVTDEDVNQELGDVDINHDGTNGGSIIAGGNSWVDIANLTFRISVQGGRWYFFCFPFDVKREDIHCENGADWIFRYYDGQERAENGKGGWKNVTSDGNGNHLKAATGYIFQCSKNDVLVLSAKNQKIKQEKKYNELVEHVVENMENMQDASWNYVGNPYLSYYAITGEDYSAPITVWDGSKYVAIRPGDDDYQLAPFEAFFVQKPVGVAQIEYNPEQQMTYTQTKDAAAKASARRALRSIDPNRLLVNFTLCDGVMTDRTRVVFNNSVSMEYETDCDAAKFTTAGVPQLYTIDGRAVKYAINERPVHEGIVTMGYIAPVQGNYTIAAPRMDTPMLLKDNVTGIVHDFSEGDYVFMSDAGSFDDRFVVMMKAGETGIGNSEFRTEKSELYNVKGQRVTSVEERDVYIKDNRKVVNL